VRGNISQEMSTVVHLLGRPRITPAGGAAYQFRSRKSWAVLAYLLMGEQPPSRSRLAALLFDEADDPVRALRWCLSEVRRGLGDGGSIDGDPVVLQLAPGSVVDVDVVARGSWADAVALPGLGAELLDGVTMHGAAAFETWLLSKQREVAAASEAILHEAALGSMSQHDVPQAIEYAARAAAMSPFDENHQALLIWLYRLAGDDDAAARQYAACHESWARELGLPPGVAVETAMHEELPRPEEDVDDATIEAILEAGTAAMTAGATASGLSSLRMAAMLADGAASSSLRVRARLALAESLIHSLRGLDEEGLAMVHEADEIATAHDLPEQSAVARTELGYVDFLRGRYDRAAYWLVDAIDIADGSPATTAKALTYLGSTQSDRASYPEAAELLTDAVELARSVGNARSEAYGLSMLGRLALLRGEHEEAGRRLDASIEVAQREHWLAFLPWPQALRGAAQLARGDTDAAERVLHQAFARACQLRDPCWEGISARGVALVAAAHGEPDRAVEILADGRTRTTRLPDPYAWVDVHLLDAMCALGVRHHHPKAAAWVEEMRELSARHGMRELVVRSLLHGAGLGRDGDLATATLLVDDIDNPALHELVAAASA
jgi:DNA-binding SARP family transcriptional activator